jgi:DNA-binding CsgD family transcriptional regulator
MGMFDDSFERSISEVETVDSMGALRAFIVRLLARYELMHAVYHAISLPHHLEANPIVILTYPEQWVEHYLARNYLAVDPVVAAASTNLLPFDWAELSQRSARVKQMFGEADEFGIGRQGLTFPIRGPLGDHALFSITSDADVADWHKLRFGYMRDFQLFAHLIHGKVLALDHAVALPFKPLSAREREVLSWAATGLHNDQIAHKLAISERVVRAYFESARHKLNCLNRSHVLARAVGLRMVTPAAPAG